MVAVPDGVAQLGVPDGLEDDQGPDHETRAGLQERVVAVVLLGRDRDVIAAALREHAPDVPVVEVAETGDGAMDRVVAAAADLARPGDTVLLAPGCASMDMFTDYAARGDAFAAAVYRLRDR